MHIDNNTKLSALKASFNKKFPGLKIEFYQKKHKDHTGSPNDIMYKKDYSIKEISDVIKGAELTLDPQMLVSDFEDMLESQFGLHVQVFRKSNQLWLQTITTDDWTLEVQNQKGLNSMVD